MLIYLSILDTYEEKNKFVQIYNQYRQTMFYVANNILKDDFLSEDAVHEAFINIAKSMDNISDVFCPRTRGYVVVIVRNVSLNMLKKQKSVLDIEDERENIAEYLSLEDEVMSKLSVDIIVGEIGNLPEIYRDILYLSYVEDLSTREISELINIPNEAVKKRLQRGRKKLIESIREAV